MTREKSYHEVDDGNDDGSYLYFSPRASILVLASSRAQVWILWHEFSIEEY